MSVSVRPDRRDGGGQKKSPGKTMWVEHQIIQLSEVRSYIHNKTGVMPSLWKIKQWVAAKWIHLLQPAGYDRRHRYVLKSEIDRFIAEHTK